MELWQCLINLVERDCLRGVNNGEKLGKNRTYVSMQMMMQVTLTRPPVVRNAQIEIIQASLDTSIKSRKIELILAALSSFNSPHTKKDILNTPSFIESVDLMRRMSPGGKLALARTLLAQLS